jgi:transposase-like protein
MARSSDSGKVVAWRRRVRRFGRSGLTVARFCEQEGVSAASFYRWRNRLAEQGRPARDAAARRVGTANGVDHASAFQAVRVATCIRTGADAAVAIHLPGGVRVDVPAGSLDAIRAVLGELLRQDAATDRGASPC